MAVSGMVKAEEREQATLENLLHNLRTIPATSVPTIYFPDSGIIELPPSLASVLLEAVEALVSGAAVTISPIHRMLTTTEAGEILGVSRQFLTRLIDRGDLPCEMANSHRRIRLNDLLKYQARRDAKREQILDEMTAQSQELGAYSAD